MSTLDRRAEKRSLVSDWRRGSEQDLVTFNINNNNNYYYYYYVFVPVAIETGGTWHPQVEELVQEIGRRTANITGDARESTFLFQQLSVALQRGNAVSFQNTFTTS